MKCDIQRVASVLQYKLAHQLCGAHPASSKEIDAICTFNRVETKLRRYNKFSVSIYRWKYLIKTWYIASLNGPKFHVLLLELLINSVRQRVTYCRHREVGYIGIVDGLNHPLTGCWVHHSLFVLLTRGGWMVCAAAMAAMNNWRLI